MNAIRTREKAVFMSYCRDLAERRFSQGFRAEEVCYALKPQPGLPEGAGLPTPRPRAFTSCSTT